jgi:hypothetical protein
VNTGRWTEKRFAPSEIIADDSVAGFVLSGGLP